MYKQQSRRQLMCFWSTADALQEIVRMYRSAGATSIGRYSVITLQRNEPLVLFSQSFIELIFIGLQLCNVKCVSAFPNGSEPGCLLLSAENCSAEIPGCACISRKVFGQFQRVCLGHINGITFNCCITFLFLYALKEYFILQENPYTVRYIHTVLIVHLLCPLVSR